MKTLAVILSLLAAYNPLTVFAVSYPPHLYHAGDRRDISFKGDSAYLFHSGTKEAKRIIHIKDILTVFRTKPSCEVIEVGRIRITSFIGEIYLKGEVVEGEIRPDDIARKESVSCLVISAGMCNHNQ
ncbi:MAG: hypothetical protein ACYC69_08395 [Thermodesulfovibrionales bacterium]